MNPKHRPYGLPVLLLATLLVTAPAMAAPPGGAGGGKGGGEDAPRQERRTKAMAGERSEQRVRVVDQAGQGKNTARKPVQPGAHFDARNRDAVQRYYASAGKDGKDCPPGLAKKNNGCLPPGQAKKQWQIGQPLPATVVLSPVPRQVVVSLPPVPHGHKYVQVAGDILLIAVGTSMVVDGIEGLMSR